MIIRGIVNCLNKYYFRYVFFVSFSFLGSVSREAVILVLIFCGRGLVAGTSFSGLSPGGLFVCLGADCMNPIVVKLLSKYYNSNDQPRNN